jgi:NAD(P)-dependent dehydrogenase (short-subunit alcohol dehydrogenase family)
LHGQVAIVTGGASGIGAATARLLAAKGVRVVIADIDDGKGQAVAAGIGGTARFVHCDVASPGDTERLIGFTASVFREPDVLVNDAAILSSKTVHETDPAEWRRVIDVNLGGVYNCCRSVLPGMLTRRSGCIINLASPHAYATGRAIAAYAAAKGGVLALTRQMALDYIRHGIRVNCVVPGAIDTPMLAADTQQGAEWQENLRGWERNQPIGRLGTPEDVARVIVWLCTDAAAFLVGSPVIADGGLLAQLLP